MAGLFFMLLWQARAGKWVGVGLLEFKASGGAKGIGSTVRNWFML